MKTYVHRQFTTPPEVLKTKSKDKQERQNTIPPQVLSLEQIDQ